MNVYLEQQQYIPGTVIILKSRSTGTSRVRTMHIEGPTTVIDTNSISNGLYVPVTKINNYNNNDYIPQQALILTHSVMFTNSYQT